MKNLLALFTILLSIFTYSQEERPVLRGGYEIFLGVGTTIPSSDMKSINNMGNLTHYHLGGYIPLFDFGGAIGGPLSLGLNVRGEYFTGNSAYDISAYQPYNITGQTGLPNIAAKGSGTPKQAGFKTEAGAQANFNFGRYTLSPLLNLAYINFKQQEFSIVQTSSVNGQNYDYDLYRQAESKTSGVGVVAGIRHRYRFGKDWRFSIYAETNYTFGPSVTTESSSLLPEGMANAQGNYNLNQLNLATRTADIKSTKFNGFGASIGIGIELGGGSTAIVKQSVKDKWQNPYTGQNPLRIHTRVFCENGKKVMKNIGTDGMVTGAIIYSEIPCNQNTWPIEGVEGYLKIYDKNSPNASQNSGNQRN